MKYQLIEGDHGMGNMGDYKTRTIAYFSTLQDAVDFFRNNEICVGWNDEPEKFDLGVFLYRKGKSSGLGVRDYALKEITNHKIKVDPKTLEELYK